MFGGETRRSFPHRFEATGSHDVAVGSDDVNLLRVDRVGADVCPVSGFHNILRNDLRRSEAIWKLIGILWCVATASRLPGRLGLDWVNRMSRVDFLSNMLTGQIY